MPRAEIRSRKEKGSENIQVPGCYNPALWLKGSWIFLTPCPRPQCEVSGRDRAWTMGTALWLRTGEVISSPSSDMLGALDSHRVSKTIFKMRRLGQYLSWLKSTSQQLHSDDFILQINSTTAERCSTKTSIAALVKVEAYVATQGTE